MNKRILLVLLCVLLLSACGTSLPPHIAMQFATPTATPFLPGPFEKSSIEEIVYINDESENDQFDFKIDLEKENSAEVWGEYAAPSMFSDIAIPAPSPKLDIQDGMESIIILGSDQRPDDPSYRTDVILLLVLDKNTDKASMISFPRDLYVYQPGFKMDRINSAHFRGGDNLVYQMIEYNFGIRPDHLVLVNFDGFRSIINSLGGIDVDVPSMLTDHRDGIGDFTVLPGDVTMDAETALWYVRSRGSSNDFDRAHRQQEVLSGLFFSAFSFDLLSNASDIYSAYQESVSTDISLVDFARLLPVAGKIFSSRDVENFSIGEEDALPWINSGNAYVLLPDLESIFSKLTSALK